MSAPQGGIEAVVFDLDGTLADTRTDIANAMNHVLMQAKLPTHSPDAYRHFIGNGVDVMVERAAAPCEYHQLDQLKQGFRQRYGDHLLDETVPYPGICALLKTLALKGVPMAVLSNKPQQPTATVVNGLFELVPFRTILGQRPGIPKKPDPTAMLEILALFDVSPKRCALVGDTAVDMGCAAATGMVAVGVGWGFRDREELLRAGADHIIEQPEELLTLLSTGQSTE